jgi:lysine 6-dehydrogenase
MVDVGMIIPETFTLDGAAREAGITIVPSCGLDMGIDRVLEGFAATRFDVVENIYVWCGGFPQKNTPGYNNPLHYKVSWNWRRAIESYLGKVSILQDGQVVQVDKMSGPANPEIITFQEPIGECEAFYTSAPFDTIEHLGLKGVKNAWNKTVRWKGHCEIWTKLIALGLTDTEPLKVKQCEVAPIDFLAELGNKRFQYEEGEGDVVVERVQVGGQEDGKKTAREYQLVDFYDKKRNVTAMGRTTAYTCSIISQIVRRGEITQKGIVHPSKIGWNTQLADRFFAELAKRDIHITEKVMQPLA